MRADPNSAGPIYFPGQPLRSDGELPTLTGNRGADITINNESNMSKKVPSQRENATATSPLPAP